MTSLHVISGYPHLPNSYSGYAYVLNPVQSCKPDTGRWLHHRIVTHTTSGGLQHLHLSVLGAKEKLR